jgi:hypothetical protein
MYEICKKILKDLMPMEKATSTDPEEINKENIDYFYNLIQS